MHTIDESPATPLISVVIPTFNRRHLILDAIESVLSQNYPRIEIIVVDDASTDDTVEYLKSQTFSVPFRVIRLETNSGPSVARNKGIAHASGKYVALLDSDDRWHPDKLALQVAAAEGSPDHDRVSVYSACVIRRRNETVVRPRAAIGHAEGIADYLFCRGGYFGQSSILVSLAAARTVPYPTDLRLHEDWDWYIQLQQAGVRFLMVPRALCIVDDRATQGRASAPHPAVSFAVAARWEHVISRRAYLAFAAKIAPQLRGTNSLQAARLILRAYAVGAIGSVQLFALAGSLVHPELRQWAYRIRALASRHQLEAAGCGGNFENWTAR